MKLFRFFLRKNWMSLRTVIRIYPVFLLLGIQVRIRPDYKHIEIRIPNRWYLKNNSNTTFGGVLLLASDPFPALVFEYHFPGTRAFTLSHSIRYLRPAVGKLSAVIALSGADLNELGAGLAAGRSVQREFEYYFKDVRGHKVAEVTSVAFVRKERVI